MATLIATPTVIHPHAFYGPDRIGLVGFNDTGFVLCEPLQPNAPQLQTRIQRLEERIHGRHTHIAAGLNAAVTLFRYVPRGVLRRIWLLSDGVPNRGVERIMPAVQAAYEAHININCIGIGDSFWYDEHLLRRIAAATHRGRYIPITTLWQLTDALLDRGDTRHFRRHARSETTVIVIDLSGSMLGPMEGKRKIDVVEEALQRLVAYKQAVFS